MKRIVMRVQQMHLRLNINSFFFIFILLATCSLWGQVNNNLKVQENFIKVTKRNNKIFFEFHENLLGQEILFVRHSLGYKQVQWQKINTEIILLELPIKSLADVIIPINGDPSIGMHILGVFPVIKNKDKPEIIQIEVSSLFNSESVEWNSQLTEKEAMNLPIEEILYFDNEVVLTTSKSGIIDNKLNSGLRRDYSFYLLPKPMIPRPFDYRIGFFIEDEISGINHKTINEKGNISRWRLEKKDPSKRFSEPVKPIIFYLDSQIPDKFKKYVKAGILEWQAAFNKAGFINAIEILEKPQSIAQWPINSVNFSIVRWENENNIRGSEDKSGSTVSKIVDYRTGEILKSDILIKSSYQQLMDEYYIRCAPLDPRAQNYPFPDDLIGELLQSIVAHEAGHAFGLRDGNYGEFSYPFSKIRDKDWLTQMGHTPSIMNYSRHNYLSQPEDSIPPSLLIQRTGPTDLYTINWGYNVDYDKNDNIIFNKQLDSLIELQEKFPWLSYVRSGYEKIGPQFSHEVSDNDNPIKSAELGLVNLRRVIDLLPKTTKNNNDTALLDRLYKKTLMLWRDQMSHISSLIGGYRVPVSISMETRQDYIPLKKKTQIESLKFMVKNVFDRPKWLSEPEFHNKTQYSVFSDYMLEMQLEILEDLLNPLRMKRLQYMERNHQFEGISNELIELLQHGLWKEIFQKNISIEPYRQELQVAYINLAAESLSSTKEYFGSTSSQKYVQQTEFTKSIFSKNLAHLQNKLKQKLETTSENIISFHLRNCYNKIEKILSN